MITHQLKLLNTNVNFKIFIYVISYHLSVLPTHLHYRLTIIIVQHRDTDTIDNSVRQYLQFRYLYILIDVYKAFQVQQRIQGRGGLQG